MEEVGSSETNQETLSLRHNPEDSNLQDRQWRYWRLNECCGVVSVSCVEKLLLSWCLKYTAGNVFSKIRLCGCEPNVVLPLLN
jgi:hypothetical protein